MLDFVARDVAGDDQRHEGQSGRQRADDYPYFSGGNGEWLVR